MSGAQGDCVPGLGDALGCSCAAQGVCDRQEARAGTRGAESARRRRAHEPTRPRPDNTRRIGDDARAGAAPAPRSPGRQALESALSRAAPPTDLAGDGVSTRPRAPRRPRPPTGDPEATRGDRPQLQRERIKLGRRALQAWSPVKLGCVCGGTRVAPTHRMQDARERGPRARRTLHPSWATCGWASPLPKACRTSEVVGPFLKRQDALRFPSPSLGLLLLVLLPAGPPCALPSSWPSPGPQPSGQTDSGPLDVLSCH